MRRLRFWELEVFWKGEGVEVEVVLEVGIFEGYRQWG